ncbi:hypothetical protein SKAU_G00275430 [Synaphobranchus kaupii]|uniref:CCHC-type domain-containing protein n=1 Tax=Synaphobranchus kaupii TaxID=118154 RepID=A0A9Q1F106_SYNKA|nr:hypothetical protein SKAU_G00275430 [Synaphobranchus kaupii]
MAVVVFVKEERLVSKMIERGIVIREIYTAVSPLSVPSVRITVSGVPPFIPNAMLENELRRFGKLASGFKTVSLGCKDSKLKHVQSLRRQVFMFLDSPTQNLEVAFRVKHGAGSYMVYASSGQLKCSECGDVGHKRFACPHRQQAEAGSADANTPPAASGSEAGERSATPGDKETAAQPEVSDPGAENAETPVAEQAVASSSAGAETVIRGEGTSTEPTEITGSAQEIPSSQVAGAQGWIY